MTLRSMQSVCINIIIFLLTVGQLNSTIIDIDDGEDDLCGRSLVKLSDLNGVLTSPSASINRNFTCDWSINVPDDYKLSLFFTYLDLTDDCKTKGSSYASLTIQIVDDGGDRDVKTTFKSPLDRVLYDNCKNYGKLSIVANQNIDLITNKISVRYNHANGSRNQGFKLIYHAYRQLDESKSEKTCKNDEFKCTNENKCILNKFYCNCYVNCLNSSDEINCNSEILETNCNYNNNNNISLSSFTQNCPYLNQVWCINRDTKQASCLHEDLIRCNGKYDCFNYVNDELNCDYSVNNNNNNNDEINSDFGFDDQQTNNYCSDPYRLDRVGWISSPNYRKSSYPDMLNCTYHLVVDAKSQIQIRFKDINLRSYTVKIGKNTYDIDFISIYDGDSIYSPLLARITYENNNRRNVEKAIDSRSNHVLIVFHTVRLNDSIKLFDTINTYGYNLTYQVKGECLSDQMSCNDIYSQYPSYPLPIKPEYNCYDLTEQRCDNRWDCHNGADELLCPNPSISMCPMPTFSCRNGQSCYHYADRCDGDSQCTDKSDELNCDSWLCNSQNGTFLCANKRCIYEQWVCDGTNDCDDGSDEMNCPTPFTRRVITTAVLGGTLCCLLLVMALGCACKLYTLRTIEYRTNIRLAASARRARQQRQQQSLTSPTSTTSSSSRSRRRPFSVFRIIRRNQSSPPQQTTSSSSATISNDNSTASLIRSASTSSLDYNNLIAPPTYNQTMGLVDEYEQRQIAFIEHMRSIINSSNNTASNGASSIGAGGTTSTQTGTSHRTSSRSTRRRSHSSRHGVSSSGGGSSSNTETINPSDQQQQQQQQSSGTSSSGRQHRRRHHRHHHRHHHHYYHHHGHCPSTAGSTSSSNPAAVTCIPSSSSSHNRVYNDLDMNRMSTNPRNLQTLVPAPTLIRQSATSTSILMPQQLTQNNLNNNAQSSSLTSSQPITSVSAATAAGATTSTTTTKLTNNLKDRIAKLIKDIVNHGDNIQYMQLSDTRSQQNNSIIQMQHHQQQQQQPAAPPQLIQLQQRNSEPQQPQQQRSTTTDNNCEQKDDVSLIEP